MTSCYSLFTPVNTTKPRLHTRPRRQRPRWLKNRINEIVAGWGVSRDTVVVWLREFGTEGIKYDIPLALALLKSTRIHLRGRPYQSARHIADQWHRDQELLKRLDAHKRAAAETKTTIETK